MELCVCAVPSPIPWPLAWRRAVIIKANHHFPCSHGKSNSFSKLEERGKMQPGMNAVGFTVSLSALGPLQTFCSQNILQCKIKKFSWALPGSGLSARHCSSQLAVILLESCQKGPTKLPWKDPLLRPPSWDSKGKLRPLKNCSSTHKPAFKNLRASPAASNVLKTNHFFLGVLV